MLYGTPTRAAHRASAGGGLALLVRGVGNTGQHRPAARRRAPREPQRAAELLAQGLAALIALSVATLAGAFVVAGFIVGGKQPSSEASTTPLASRAEDPEPLSLREVFPDRQVRPPAAAPYRITLTHVDTDCRVATVGTLGRLLADHGCSQVVRAGLVAPYGDYRVTAGVFNLADSAGAEDVDGRLRRLVETGDGNFATLPAGTSSDPAAPVSRVGWHTRGHYLLYCVITRPGGRLVTSDDPYPERITADLVDAYLTDTLERRASGG
jgi:hypothetical protein